MIEPVKDVDGKVIAYTSWSFADIQGNYYSSIGEQYYLFCYIDDFWVHKKHRKEIRTLSLKMLEAGMKKHPWVTHIYFDHRAIWRKEKRGKGVKVKLYSVEVLYRLLSKGRRVDAIRPETRSSINV